MYTYNPHKAGIVTGIFVGGLHLGWALLVYFGYAQSLLNFVFTLHMLRPLFVVDGFSAILALSLVLVTAILGYLFGYLYIVIWNRLHK